METKSKNISLKAILIIMSIGIWAIVLQNAGVIPIEQNVYVKGGYIDAYVSGSVNVDGGVDVGNIVDINIREINGKSNVFYRDRDGSYILLPTYSPVD